MNEDRGLVTQYTVYWCKCMNLFSNRVPTMMGTARCDRNLSSVFNTLAFLELVPWLFNDELLLALNSN